MEFVSKRANESSSWCPDVSPNLAKDTRLWNDNENELAVAHKEWVNLKIPQGILEIVVKLLVKREGECQNLHDKRMGQSDATGGHLEDLVAPC